jgi:hypothetical protein
VEKSYLVGGTALVRAEHDHVGGGVGKLLLVQLLGVTQKLHVCTTALETLLELDLILHHEGLILGVNLLWELGGDGVVSGGVLQHETLIASDAGEDGRLLDRPLSNVGPVLLALGVLLLRVGDFPSRIPVVGELFEEGRFQGGRLLLSAWDKGMLAQLTVKRGLSTALLDGSGTSRGSWASSASALPARSAVAQTAAVENRIARDVQRRKRAREERVFD